MTIDIMTIGIKVGSMTFGIKVGSMTIDIILLALQLAA